MNLVHYEKSIHSFVTENRYKKGLVFIVRVT